MKSLKRTRLVDEIPCASILLNHGIERTREHRLVLIDHFVANLSTKVEMPLQNVPLFDHIISSAAALPVPCLSMNVDATLGTARNTVPLRRRGMRSPLRPKPPDRAWVTRTLWPLHLARMCGRLRQGTLGPHISRLHLSLISCSAVSLVKACRPRSILTTIRRTSAIRCPTPPMSVLVLKAVRLSASHTATDRGRLKLIKAAIPFALSEG